MIISFGPKTLINTRSLREKVVQSLRWNTKIKKSDNPRDEISKENLPVTGRSSGEVLGDTLSNKLTGYLGYWDVLQPEIPWEVQKYITLISICNPDVNQAVKNSINLGNTGHNIIVDAKNSANVIARLNELSYKVYQVSAGIDGLVNHYFEQGQVSGALSSEDVIFEDFSGVKKVVIVPPYCVRFKYIDGDYRPFQEAGALGYLDLLELNPHTFTYYALNVWQNKPYAVPPYLPAIKPILIQDEFLKNIQAMSKKLGLLGLNIVTVKKLARKPNETEVQYKKRNQEHLDAVAESVKLNYSQGVLVLPEDQTHDNHPLVNDARGVREIFDMIEEQVFSGVASHPAMQGRPNSTTEAYARIIYGLMLNSIGNLRRLIKRRLEKTYRLDLILAGIPFDFISIVFNDDQRLQPNVEAMADRIQQQIVFEQVTRGAISPSEAAQKLGMSEWYDEKLLYEFIKSQVSKSQGGGELKTNPMKGMKEFQFSKHTQRYELITPSLGSISLKDDDQKEAAKAQQILERFGDEYLREVLPFFDQLKPDSIVWAKNYLAENYEAVKANNDLFFSSLRAYLESHPQYTAVKDNPDFGKVTAAKVIDAAKYYRESDLSVFSGKPPAGVKFKFGAGDKQAADLLAQCDHFFFSKFISNKDFGTEIKQFVKDWFARGEALHGGWTDEAVIEFVSKFGFAFDADVYSQMKRICNSSIGMLQVNSRFKQLYEGGFKYAIWVEAPGCCEEICEPFKNNEIPVAKVWKRIEEGFIKAESTEKALEYIKSCNRTEDDTKKSIEEIIGEGKSWGKLHPHCKGTLKGKFEE